MNKAEQIILVMAGVALIVIFFLPQPKEGSSFEWIWSLFTVGPMIIAIIILARHRSDPTTPFILRILGYTIIILWILSFFIRGRG